ncbi:APC family permease [Alteribacillus sp. HJP-4]|uniref:APC family permease n=1 Tax=Alteribacillus sp. HJP-4 TaxID=2775394 RepID=UPI0035CCCE33
MKPSINLPQGIALYIAAILGSGVLFISGTAASIAGPASLISWGIVIFITFPLAYSFACLSQKYPDAGGAATFVRHSFGYHMGNLVGWFYFICAAVGQTIVSLTGAFYVENAFPFPIPTMWTAILILFIGVLMNFFGIQISGRVAIYISSCLVFLLLSVVFLSLPFIEFGHFFPFRPFGWESIGTAAAIIFWSYFGWEAICNLAPQFKNPQKDIIASTWVSAILIGIIFLLLSVITIGTGTYGSVENDLSPIGVMMEQSLGVGAKVITAILAFIVCVGTVNAFVASLGQLGYSLSRDGAFPKWMITGNTQVHSPKRVVLFVFFFSGFGIVATEIIRVGFYDILFIPTSLGVCVYILSMAAAVKLFDKGTLPWNASLFSLSACLLILPFFQLYIVVPIVILLLYILYIKFKNTSSQAEQKVNPF